jgi:tetratricopeptide (TPR) repeat protein
MLMRRYVSVMLLLPLFLAAGCSQSLYSQGKLASEQGDYNTALARLYDAVRENPKNYEAWCQIGVVYFKQGSSDKAEEAFGTSNGIQPNALSNFYLGLIFEQANQTDKAIAVYGAAVNLAGDKKTKAMIENRLDVLNDQKLMLSARRAVEREDSLAAAAPPENSIAVINFDGSSLSDDLEPLALGLAEFVAIDLAKIERLEVLERLKIDVILDELALSESKYADPQSAPRLGHLLGSRRVVIGTINSTGDESFRLTGQLVNTVDKTIQKTEPREGRLDRFFEVEKAFVFALLDTLGIELSRAERDAIEEVPTESLLAFMAYSQGLEYQKRGLYYAASNSFRNAGLYDSGFSQAGKLAQRMTETTNYFRDIKAEPGAERSDFESRVTTSMTTGPVGTGFDQVQASNLINSNFIINNGLYWNYGTLPIEPPGGGPIKTGFGTVIIKGSFDADQH